MNKICQAAKRILSVSNTQRYSTLALKPKSIQIPISIILMCTLRLGRIDQHSIAYYFSGYYQKICSVRQLVHPMQFVHCICIYATNRTNYTCSAFGMIKMKRHIIWLILNAIFQLHSNNFMEFNTLLIIMWIATFWSWTTTK